MRLLDLFPLLIFTLSSSYTFILAFPVISPYNKPKTYFLYKKKVLLYLCF